MNEYMASPQGAGHRARYKITLDAGYLRAELRNRRTAEETRLFVSTVAAASKVLECGRVLISVNSSIPMSMLERSVFFAHLDQLGASAAHKVAVVDDALNPGAAGEYLEPFAQRVNVRRFADEAAALQWFRDRRHWQERRRGQERRC